MGSKRCQDIFCLSLANENRRPAVTSVVMNQIEAMNEWLRLQEVDCHLPSQARIRCKVGNPVKTGLCESTESYVHVSLEGSLISRKIKSSETVDRKISDTRSDASSVGGSIYLASDQSLIRRHKTPSRSGTSMVDSMTVVAFGRSGWSCSKLRLWEVRDPLRFFTLWILVS
jgi:hypothetical protein